MQRRVPDEAIICRIAGCGGAGVLRLQQAQPEVGTFTLPEALSEDTWGTDYRVYLLAEDVNGTYQTDYAGFPLEITAYGE